MRVTISTFANNPDRGRGLSRDMAVRWALEEVGRSYDLRLLTFPELKEPAHRARHPFGQIPTYEEADLILFESGAIVLTIAEKHSGLLPEETDARSRAIGWIFAALSTIEPPVVEFSMAALFDRDRSWFAERQTMLEGRVRTRLADLSAWLGVAEWLEGEFSAGDLMMIAVLRRLKSSGLLEDYPQVAAYVARGEARPAFRRAFEAQRQLFESTAAV